MEVILARVDVVEREQTTMFSVDTDILTDKILPVVSLFSLRSNNSTMQTSQ